MNNEIKKIRIFVSVESGLEEERLEVIDLVHCINNTLYPLGICFIVDSKCDDNYEDVIKQCPLSLVIVCSDVSDNSLLRKRILNIYTNHPENHLYVFFNEPITPENKKGVVLSFRKYLGDMYGHFPVTKTTGEIRFELILRLFDYALSRNKMVEFPFIEDSIDFQLKTNGDFILFGSEIIAEKGKISCFSANEVYRQLEDELKEQQMALETSTLTEEERGRVKAEIFRIEKRLSEESLKILDIALKLSNNTLGLNSLVLNEAIDLFNKGQVNDSIKLIDNHISSILEPSLAMDTASKDTLRSFIPLIMYKVEHLYFDESIQEETEYNEIETAYKQLEDITERINCEIVEKIELFERFYNSIGRLLTSTTEIINLRELLLNSLYKLCLHLEIDSPEKGKKTKARIAYRIGHQKLLKMDFLTAEEKLNEAYDTCKSINKDYEHQTIIHILIRLGDLYREKAKHQMRGINQKIDAYSIAMDKYNEALEIAERSKNDELKSFIFSRIGELYRTGYGKNAEALLYHLKSYDIVKTITNDKNSLVGKCINLGATYAEIATEKGDISNAKLALDMYHEGLILIQASKESSSLEKSLIAGKIHHNIGEIYRVLCKNSTDNAQKCEYRNNALEHFECAYSIRYPMARYSSNKYLEEFVNTAESYSRMLMSELLQVIITKIKDNEFSLSDHPNKDFESKIEQCDMMLNLAYEIIQPNCKDVYYEYKKVKLLPMLYCISIWHFLVGTSIRINDSYYDEAISICQKARFTDSSIQITLERMNKLAILAKVRK